MPAGAPRQRPFTTTLHVSRDRPVLGRRPVGQVEEDFVHVAPAPALGRVVALDDRVAGGAEMLGGVAIGRTVAAADVAAGPAQAQVDPARADLEAFLAP